MVRLHDWWQRLTGTTGEPEAPPRHAPPQPKVQPPVEGLQLVDGAAQRTPSRVGEAGFDPYASDAGYAKPHSWERVDHD